MKILNANTLPKTWRTELTCKFCFSLIEYEIEDFLPRPQSKIDSELGTANSGAAVLVNVHCPVCNGIITVAIPALVYRIFVGRITMGVNAMSEVTDPVMEPTGPIPVGFPVDSLKNMYIPSRESSVVESGTVEAKPVKRRSTSKSSDDKPVDMPMIEIPTYRG